MIMSYKNVLKTKKNKNKNMAGACIHQLFPSSSFVFRTKAGNDDTSDVKTLMRINIVPIDL